MPPGVRTIHVENGSKRRKRCKRALPCTKPSRPSSIHHDHGAVVQPHRAKRAARVHRRMRHGRLRAVRGFVLGLCMKRRGPPKGCCER